MYRKKERCLYIHVCICIYIYIYTHVYVHTCSNIKFAVLRLDVRAACRARVLFAVNLTHSLLCNNVMSYDIIYVYIYIYISVHIHTERERERDA